MLKVATLKQNALITLKTNIHSPLLHVCERTLTCQVETCDILSGRQSCAPSALVPCPLDRCHPDCIPLSGRVDLQSPRDALHW